MDIIKENTCTVWENDDVGKGSFFDWSKRVKGVYTRESRSCLVATAALWQ